MICTRCLEDKPATAEYFSRRSIRRKPGLRAARHMRDMPPKPWSSHCLDCRRKDSREWYARKVLPHESQSAEATLSETPSQKEPTPRDTSTHVTAIIGSQVTRTSVAAGALPMPRHDAIPGDHCFPSRAMNRSGKNSR